MRGFGSCRERWERVIAEAPAEGHSAGEAMKLTAEKNELIEEAFHAYFHGRTGAPMRHRFQSWNAGSFLLAYQAIRKRKADPFGGLTR